MPGITDEFKILMATEMYGNQTHSLHALLAAPWFQFHEAPPGPHGTANPALDTRRVQVEMTAPATDVGSHLYQIKNTNLEEIANWIAPTQDIEQVLTDFSCWSTDHSGVGEVCIGRGPLGGLLWRGCSANGTNNKLTSAGHGLSNGNLVEVMAVPMQDPTLPGFGPDPDTRYVVRNALGADFELALPGTPNTTVPLLIDASVIVVRARRHTIDMDGRLQIPAGMIALPFI